MNKINLFIFVISMLLYQAKEESGLEYLTVLNLTLRSKFILKSSAAKSRTKKKDKEFFASSNTAKISDSHYDWYIWVHQVSSAVLGGIFLLLLAPPSISLTSHFTMHSHRYSI